MHAARVDASLSLNRSPVVSKSALRLCLSVSACFEPRHVGKTYRKHFDSFGGCFREGEHEIDSESPVGWSAPVRVIRYERSDLGGPWRMRISENLLQLLRSAEIWDPTAEFVQMSSL
jgi:hypothetical protein